MIKVSQKGQIQIIELNRPKVNAINAELIRSIHNQLNQSEKNKSIKGIILTGSNGVFSAGLDIISLYDKDIKYMQ